MKEKTILKVLISDRIASYPINFSPANVYAEPYFLLKEKCDKQGFKYTKVLATLMDLYVKGDIEIRE